MNRYEQEIKNHIEKISGYTPFPVPKSFRRDISEQEWNATKQNTVLDYAKHKKATGQSAAKFSPLRSFIVNDMKRNLLHIR